MIWVKQKWLMWGTKHSSQRFKANVFCIPNRVQRTQLWLADSMLSDTGHQHCNSEVTQLTDRNGICTFVHISVSGLHCRISLTIVAFPFSTAQYNAVLLSCMIRENQGRSSIKKLLFVNIKRWEVMSIYMISSINFWEILHERILDRLSIT